MTLKQAKKLYLSVVGETTHAASEWPDIHREMEAVVSARSDRAAADVIRWWGCWDRSYTATSVARQLREEWARMRRIKS